MIIRNANIIDIENIAKLYITNWKNTYSELLPQDFLDSLTVNSAIYSQSGQPQKLLDLMQQMSMG